MKRFPDFFREPHKLLNVDDTEPVLIALSGGADSRALLQLLYEASRNLGFTLYAAHVNHNIRTQEYGNEAARDEQFCRELCASLGVKLFTLSTDVPGHARDTKTSIETAAREVRYSFFEKVMLENGIKILATAHNADDNLETLIFRLARGCGIEGMSGIPEVRSMPTINGGVAVRPLLTATKAEILEFCRENDLEYVNDSTNFEDDCTRNRIRHNIIPELVELFGAPQKAATRLAQLASSDAEYLDMTARDLLSKSGGVIEIKKLNSLHVSIASRVISIAYSAVADTYLEQTHIDAVLKLAREGIAHSSVSLPRKIAARIEENKLVFVPDETRSASEDYCQTLKSGINVIPSQNFAILFGGGAPEHISEADGVSYSFFSSAKLKIDATDILVARNRREGDTIRDGGMTKKVKKLLCDKKIALDDRDTLPFVCCNDEIIYIPACAVADAYKSGKNDAFTQITIYKKNAQR